MSGKVIQGYFFGGRPRPPAPVVRPPAISRPPGPPAPAFAGRPVAQARGASDSFQVDPGTLGLASGGGRPLPDAVRAKMEAALRADFSGVRVHVGPQAERIGAIAFTMGTDIYFAPGRFQPETAHGQQLLGHELAHVVQQRQGRVRNPAHEGIAVVQDRALEAEADHKGHRAAAHRVQLQPKLAPVGAKAAATIRMSGPTSTGPGHLASAGVTGPEAPTDRHGMIALRHEIRWGEARRSLRCRVTGATIQKADDRGIDTWPDRLTLTDMVLTRVPKDNKILFENEIKSGSAGHFHVTIHASPNSGLTGWDPTKVPLHGRLYISKKKQVGATISAANGKATADYEYSPDEQEHVKKVIQYTEQAYSELKASQPYRFSQNPGADQYRTTARKGTLFF